MKIINKETKSIINTCDKSIIERLLGYPDKFEEVKENTSKKVDNKLKAEVTIDEDKVAEKVVDNAEKKTKKSKKED